MEPVRTLIISESSDTRQQLKRLLDRLEQTHESRLCATLAEAEEALATARYPLILASNSFSRSDLGGFIERIKANGSAADSSLILLLKAKECDRETISNGMVLGFHGLLREPYSLAALEEITKLMPGVRRTETRHRLRAATGLLISAFIQANDPNLRARAPKHADLLQEAEESCRRFKEVTGESVTSAVVAELHQNPVSKRLAFYSGASKRVREMVAKQLFGSSEVLAHFKKILLKD